MNTLLLRTYVSMKEMLEQNLVECARLIRDAEGQDLVEYALLVCLIALAAIGGVKHVATAVTAVFSNISSSLA
jgi:pilus assembly protein Flp/PilA